jgi:hypothetical protein
MSQSPPISLIQPPSYLCSAEHEAVHLNWDTYSKRVKKICTKYDIAGYMEEDLCELKKYEIILICDDSSSMKTLTDTYNEYGKKTEDGMN